jgi:hypothetical protein
VLSRSLLFSGYCRAGSNDMARLNWPVTLDCTHSVHHVPCGLVRAQPQPPLKFFCRDTFSAAHRQVERNHPLVKGKVGILKDRAMTNRELALAFSALEEPRPSGLAAQPVDALRAAMHARGAARPAHPFDEPARLIFREAVDFCDGPDRSVFLCCSELIPRRWFVKRIKMRRARPSSGASLLHS